MPAGPLGYALGVSYRENSCDYQPDHLQGTTLPTILPRRLAERMQRSAEIRLLELPFDVPPLREKLVWNPRFTSSPDHVWMREQLVEVAGAL